MSSAALIAALMLGLAQDPQAQNPQTQGSPPQAAPARQEPPTTTLDEVVVDGRQLREQAETFVDEVAAPPERRGLARWGSRVCVGVVNVRHDVAQSMIDRVSQLALDLDVPVGEPGCTPNIVIVFAADATSMATALVERDFRAFHLGVGGLDRGRVALRAFQTTDAPVRWWHTSMPVIGNTGVRAVRMPGDTGPIFVPGEGIVNRGRPISDDLNKVIIIIDVDQLAGVSLAQLNDYVALVALAQVDPEADTRAYNTILNVFHDPLGTPGLSEWDASYLQALYASRWRERVNPSVQAAAITRIMRRAAEDDQDGRAPIP